MTSSTVRFDQAAPLAGANFERVVGRPVHLHLAGDGDGRGSPSAPTGSCESEIPLNLDGHQLDGLCEMGSRSERSMSVVFTFHNSGAIVCSCLLGPVRIRQRSEQQRLGNG